MSFPVLEERTLGAPGSVENPAADPNAAAGLRPAARVAEECTACDGSGLWRGIDGFVFVCQHCTYEMT